MRCAFTAVLLALAAGCGSESILPSGSDPFRPGTGDTFGTLTGDDSASFRIGAGANGAISGLDSEAAEVSFPTFEDPTLSIMPTGGGLLAVSQDQDDTLPAVTVQDDLLLGILGTSELTFNVGVGARGSVSNALLAFFLSRESVASAQSAVDCDANREFLDTFCLLFTLLDFDEMVALAVSEAQKQQFPITAADARTLLDKYAGPMASFCGAWDDYRQTGDPCGIAPNQTGG